MSWRSCGNPDSFSVARRACVSASSSTSLSLASGASSGQGAVGRMLTSQSRSSALEMQSMRLYASISSRRSEEHTSELQSLMRISYAVFCLKIKNIDSTVYTNITVMYTHTLCVDTAHK